MTRVHGIHTRTGTLMELVVHFGSELDIYAILKRTRVKMEIIGRTGSSGMMQHFFVTHVHCAFGCFWYY